MSLNIKEILPEIILSVGTHRSRRILSPGEIAERFKLLEENGYSKEQIAKFVKLDSTMIDRFLRLMKLSPEIRHLVDWGQSNASTISFSAASEISRLNPEEQKVIAGEILRYQLSKNEIIQVIQIRNRASKNIQKCLDDVLKMRPRIIQKHVFLGALTEEKVISYLKGLSQIERDRILREILKKNLLTGIEWSGRLGKNNFSLVGGKILADQMNDLKPNFEQTINQWLAEKVKNDDKS